MSEFTWNEPGFDRVFRSEEGPVGQYIQLVAEAVMVAADEAMIEVRPPIYPHGPERPYAITGRLKATIASRVDVDADGAAVLIGANALSRGFDYPRALETGEASIYGTRFPWLSAACIALGLDYQPLI